MEVKKWTYEEFPEMNEQVPGAGFIETSGDEVGVAYFNDVKYIPTGDAQATSTPLHLQILRPFTRRQGLLYKLPCVAFVQGSGWMKQDMYKHLPDRAALARKGYVVALVEYRSVDIAAFPAQIIDTRNAIRFLRVHADTYGIDPERMVVGGDSSGGHTAVFAALRHNDDTDENLFPGVSAEVSCVLNFYGSVSVMLEDSFPTTLNCMLPDSPEGRLMGGVNLRERQDLARKVSAECNITPDTNIAPMLILHGTKDRLVNAKQSVLLYRHLKKCGKDAELYLLKGADHGGAEFWSEDTMAVVDRFIRNWL